MKNIKLIGSWILFIGFLVGLSIVILSYFRPKSSGLIVEANLPSEVYIDNRLLGTTPYESTFEPGEKVIRLVPRGGIETEPYIVKMMLVNGVKTIIRREFGLTEETSGGDISYFEPSGQANKASFRIITTPGITEVLVNNNKIGDSPIEKDNFNASIYEIKVRKEGYKERSLKVKLQKGYKLVMVVKLALIK